MEVNLDEALVVLNDYFLSITLGAGHIRNHWRQIDFTIPRLLNLAKGLSPATLRVGGYRGNGVIFTPNGSVEDWASSTTNPKSPLFQNCSKNGMEYDISCKLQCCEPNKDLYNFTMSGADWDLLNNFVLKAGWELVFGLNIFLMKDWQLAKWDSSNAQELIQYTMDRGYKVAWELGNGMCIRCVVDTV